MKQTSAPLDSPPCQTDVSSPSHPRPWGSHPWSPSCRPRTSSAAGSEPEGGGGGVRTNASYVIYIFSKLKTNCIHILANCDPDRSEAQIWFS